MNKSDGATLSTDVLVLLPQALSDIAPLDKGKLV